MLGRTPEHGWRPMRDSVIADFVVTEAMLRYFIQTIVGNLNPLLADLQAEGDDQHAQRRRAWRSTLCTARRCRQQARLSDPGAAGGGLWRAAHRHAHGQYGRDMARHHRGGGVSMYDVGEQLRGGNRFDESIVNYIRKKPVGGRRRRDQDRSQRARWRKSGRWSGERPGDRSAKIMQITSSEVTEAMAEPLQAVVSTVRYAGEDAGAGCGYHRGMVTGGGAVAQHCNLLTQETGVPVTWRRIRSPVGWVRARLENYEIMRRSCRSCRPSRARRATCMFENPSTLILALLGRCITIEQACAACDDWMCPAWRLFCSAKPPPHRGDE